MNIDHTRTWTTALRDPSLNQTTGILTEVLIEGGRAHCCLGVGCVTMGLDGRPDGQAIMYGAERAAGLPPKEFHAWLGLLTEQQIRSDQPFGSKDVGIDWGEVGELLTYDARNQYVSDTPGEVKRLKQIGCAGLNDSCHLTFSQIADVIDHFGLKATDW